MVYIKLFTFSIAPKNLFVFNLKYIILWFLKESLQNILRNEARLCKVFNNREDQS